MGSMFGKFGGKPISGESLEVIFFDEEDCESIRLMAVGEDKGSRFEAAKAVVKRTIAPTVGRNWDNKTGKLVRRSLDEVDMGDIVLANGKEAFDNTLGIIREAYYAWFGVAENVDDYETVMYGQAKKITKASKVAATSPLDTEVEKAQLVINSALMEDTDNKVGKVIDKAYPAAKPSPESIVNSLLKTLVVKGSGDALIALCSDMQAGEFRVDGEALAKLDTLRSALNTICLSIDDYVDWHRSKDVSKAPKSTETVEVISAGTT